MDCEKSHKKEGRDELCFRSADRIERQSTSVATTGRLELHLDFEKALTDAIYVRVFGMFHETLSIDGRGTIGLSYLPGGF